MERLGWSKLEILLLGLSHAAHAVAWAASEAEYEAAKVVFDEMVNEFVLAMETLRQ